MARKIEPLKAMRIGCDNVVWAPLLLDEGTAETSYQLDGKGKPLVYALPGVMALNINPNSSIETAFYDDGPGEVASTLGNVEVTFSKSSLTHEERAKILGKSQNQQGILFHSKNDIAPWGAIGFRTLRSDGSYRYVWLYKGKFIDPADNNETKGDSVNFQADEITGRFVKLNWEFDLMDSKGEATEVSVRPWKIEIDGADFGNPQIDTEWFNKVVLPNTDIIPAPTVLDMEGGI